MTSGGSYEDLKGDKFMFFSLFEVPLNLIELTKTEFTEAAFHPVCFSAPWPCKFRALQRDSSTHYYSPEVFSLPSSQDLAMKPSATAPVEVNTATRSL